MTKPFGVDISSYQGRSIDYALMKRKTKFVAVRAGISWGFEDPVFAQSWQALIGHNRIAYHVLYPGQDAIAQADWMLDIVERAGFDAKRDRLAIDIELWQAQTPHRVTEATLQMYERLKEKTGRYPIIYSAAWFVNPRMVMVPKLVAADWWLATYPRKGSAPGVEHPGPPILPRGITQYLIHQTSETGIGINVGLPGGPIDTNRWNGTDQDLQAYFGRFELGFPIIVGPGPGSGDDPDPDPEPELPEVPEPLFEALVSTVPPNRLRVRNKPSYLGGFVRWLHSGDVVPVFDVVGDWWKVAADAAEWSLSKYLAKIIDAEAIEPWSQRDPRWGNDRMGASSITMAQQGCLATAVAWLLRRLGIDTDPRRYNMLASTRGGYLYPNLMYWLFPEVLWGAQGLLEQFGIQRAEYLFFSGSGWKGAVDQILADGRDALACVDMIPGGPFNQHWVVIFDKVGNDYLMMDPWTGDVELMSKRYYNAVKIVSYRRI